MRFVWGLFVAFALFATTLAVPTITNFAITAVNGFPPTIDPSTLRNIIPVNSTLSFSWNYANDNNIEDLTQYRTLLTFTLKSRTLPRVYVNVAIDNGSIDIFLPIDAPTLSSYATLEVFDNADILIATAVTPLFDTISICDTVPNFCGPQTFNICKRSTSSCDCRAGYSGTNCEFTPCEALGCVTDHTQSVCVDTAPICNCKPGFIGDKCQYAEKCVKKCKNNGFEEFIYDPITDEITCLDTCSCLAPWVSKDGAANGCDQCPLECANGGVKKSKSCQCSCQPGYFGPTCEEHYALGKITITHLGEIVDLKSTTVLAEFTDTFNHLIASTMNLPSSSIQLFSNFSLATTSIPPEPSWNLVYRLPYSVTIDPTTNATLAPALAGIHAGWESIQADVASPVSLLQRFISLVQDIANTLPEEPTYPSIIPNPVEIALSNLNLTVGSDDAIVQTPNALYDPTCPSFFSTQCPTGIWPLPSREPFDNSDKALLENWVWIVGCSLIAFSILVIFLYLLLGTDKIVSEAETKLIVAMRQKRKGTRFDQLASRAAEKEKFKNAMRAQVNQELAKKEAILLANIVSRGGPHSIVPDQHTTFTIAPSQTQTPITRTIDGIEMTSIRASDTTDKEKVVVAGEQADSPKNLP